MTIRPTMDQINELMNSKDEGPFVMINLLRFKDDSGSGDSEKAYSQYGAKVFPLLQNAGGRIIWMGEVNEVFIGMAEDKWDKVLLVEYPSRRAFISMISSPEYEKTNHYREAAIESAVLLAGKTVLGGS